MNILELQLTDYRLSVHSRKNAKRPYVLHLVASDFFGGPERQIVRHCEDARRFGYEGIIVIYSDGKCKADLISQAEKRDIRVEILPVRNAYDPSVFRKLRFLVLEKRPLVVCAHEYRSTLLGLLVAKLFGVPVVAWSRGWTQENLKIRIYEVLDKLFIRFADCIVAVSQEQKRRLIKWGIPARRIRTVHNALDLAEFQREVGGAWVDPFKEFAIPPGHSIIATAGRLSPEKGHRYLIEAMANLVTNRKRLFLLVFGDGVLRSKLTSLAKRLGLNRNVAFPGFRKDLHQMLRHIDVFVLPSMTEGLSNVILEAFAASKPVIATAVGGNPDLVQHMETGVLVRPCDPRALAAAIEFVLSNPEKARQMAHAGNRLLLNEFSLQKQTEKICRMYDQLARI